MWKNIKRCQKCSKGWQRCHHVKKTKQNLKSCLYLKDSITLYKHSLHFSISSRWVVGYIIPSVSGCWHKGKELRGAPSDSATTGTIFLKPNSEWVMEEGTHLPVGLCRMKNRNGLSTINQGGDDLAIRIAAVRGKGKRAVLSAWGQQGDRLAGSLMLVGGCTSFLPIGWPCCNRPSGHLNTHHGCRPCIFTVSFSRHKHHLLK